MPDANGRLRGIVVPALPWSTCVRCGVADGEAEHSCPYAEEISDDHESTCNCCASCESDCCDDI